MAKWYSDSFFISATYACDKLVLGEAASRRKEFQDRATEAKNTNNKNRRIVCGAASSNLLPKRSTIIPSSTTTITDDSPPLLSPLAMGHPLLLSIGENYIKSTYAVDTRPCAIWTASKHGPLMNTRHNHWHRRFLWDRLRVIGLRGRIGCGCC